MSRDRERALDSYLTGIALVYRVALVTSPVNYARFGGLVDTVAAMTAAWRVQAAMNEVREWSPWI